MDDLEKHIASAKEKHGVGWAENFESEYREFFVSVFTNHAPTPPEADKDVEIARLNRQIEEWAVTAKNAGEEWEARNRELTKAIEASSRLLVFHGHRIEEVRNSGFPGLPQGQCECRVCRSYYADLTTARATIAERDKRIETLVGVLRGIEPYAEEVINDMAANVQEGGSWDAEEYAKWAAVTAHAAEGKEQA